MSPALATEPARRPPPAEASGRAARVGFWTGALLCGAMLALPAPAGLSDAGWAAAACAVLMAVWWTTEALPIPATSLVPLALFPLAGVAPMPAAAAPYANPIVFLFLGGFLLAMGMERSGLHRRIALAVIARVGTSPRRLVGGFVAAAATLSLGLSNTATAVMMLPIAMSVVDLARRDGEGTDADDRALATALLLGVAYACSVGGMGTLIGTPTNALLAGFLTETYGVTLSFAGWMAFGMPVAVLGTGVLYVVLTRVAFRIRKEGVPGSEAFIAEQRAGLGPMRPEETRIALVFGTVSALWMTSPLLGDLVPGLTDAGIAVAGALVLFALPSRPGGPPLLDWKTALGLPWGVLLLFGGGLSLAAAIADTGLAAWIGDGLAIASALPTWALVGLVVAVIAMLTELTSNTATAAAFLPVLAALAVSTNTPPLLLLAPAVVAASCAFMLPVATPPNAIVFGTGHVSIGQMARAGVWLNVTFIVLVTLLSVVLMPLLTGTALPDLPAGTAPAAPAP